LNTIFISYAQADRDRVTPILNSLERAGYDVRIDEKFVDIGDSISIVIRDQIGAADFVVVFLSARSVHSDWVKKEILEVLHRELKTKMSCLLLCKLDSCEMPEYFTRWKQFERVYIDLTRDSVTELLARLNQGQRPIFEDEQFIRLNLPIPQLQVFLTGEPWGWDIVETLRYNEMVDGYLLFGFKMEPWTYFKHFVLCEESNAARIRGELQSAGFLVTGSGDRDPTMNKRRIWFLLQNLPIDGPVRNNRWPTRPSSRDVT
jgi:hypothetical protein